MNQSTFSGELKWENIPVSLVICHCHTCALSLWQNQGHCRWELAQQTNLAEKYSFFFFFSLINFVSPKLLNKSSLHVDKVRETKTTATLRDTSSYTKLSLMCVLLGWASNSSSASCLIKNRQLCLCRRVNPAAHCHYFSTCHLHSLMKRTKWTSKEFWFQVAECCFSPVSSLWAIFKELADTKGRIIQNKPKI